MPREVNDAGRNHDERERKAGGAVFRRAQHGSVVTIQFVVG